MNVDHIAKSIPPFDGITNVKNLCDRVDQAVVVYKLKPSWVILNFHLLLEGEVVNWWKWAQISILQGLTDANEVAKLAELKKSIIEY